VTPNEVRGVARDRWQELTGGDVMRPLDQLKTVEWDTPATEAFTMMAREDLNQLPVVFDGRLEGIITRGHILQLLQSSAELKASDSSWIQLERGSHDVTSQRRQRRQRREDAFADRSYRSAAGMISAVRSSIRGLRSYRATSAVSRTSQPSTGTAHR
jgi:hypothetical protein